MGYKLFDLTTPFDTKAPIWPHVGDPDIEYPRLSRTAWACGKGAPGYTPVKQAARFSSVLHIGTHIDAPIHGVDRGKTVGQIPLEKCYGTGVILDFRHMKKWQKITAEDFENATPKIQENDFVVINTGWHKWWYVKDYIYFNHYPGLVPSGAEWLVKHKVKGIAGTWGALDHPCAHAPLQKLQPWLYDEYKWETGKDPDEEFAVYEPCHTILLENEITSIENAGGDIDQVTGIRCTMAAFPWRFMDGDGCMVRLVAIVDD